MTLHEQRCLTAKLAAEIVPQVQNKQEAEEIIRLLQRAIDWVYAEPQGGGAS